MCVCARKRPVECGRTYLLAQTLRSFIREGEREREVVWAKVSNKKKPFHSPPSPRRPKAGLTTQKKVEEGEEEVEEKDTAAAAFSLAGPLSLSLSSLLSLLHRATFFSLLSVCLRREKERREERGPCGLSSRSQQFLSSPSPLLRRNCVVVVVFAAAAAAAAAVVVVVKGGEVQVAPYMMMMTVKKRGRKERGGSSS